MPTLSLVGPVAAVAALTVIAVTSQAADTTGGSAPIHGSDAMDGKDKPGQDGWSWAPVPRNQAAATSATTPGERAPAQKPNPPKPDGAAAPGHDPAAVSRP